MRLVVALLVISALVFASAGAVDAVGDNPRVAELLEQDQADRKGFPNTALEGRYPIDADAVTDEDRA